MVRGAPHPLRSLANVASAAEKADKPANIPVHVPRAVFGVPLQDSMDVAEFANLPAVVFRCIQYLEAKRADQEEGIYRLSGSSAVIKALKDRFNNGSSSSRFLSYGMCSFGSIAEGDVDLLGSDECWDPHAIAGLLKSFLRELPVSILTRDLHLQFLSVIGTTFRDVCPLIAKTLLRRLRGSTGPHQRVDPTDSCLTHR